MLVPVSRSIYAFSIRNECFSSGFHLKNNFLGPIYPQDICANCLPALFTLCVRHSQLRTTDFVKYSHYLIDNIVHFCCSRYHSKYNAGENVKFGGNTGSFYYKDKPMQADFKVSYTCGGMGNRSAKTQ